MAKLPPLRLIFPPLSCIRGRPTSPTPRLALGSHGSSTLRHPALLTFYGVRHPGILQTLHGERRVHIEFISGGTHRPGTSASTSLGSAAASSALRACDEDERGPHVLTNADTVPKLVPQPHPLMFPAPPRTYPTRTHRMHRVVHPSSSYHSYVPLRANPPALLRPAHRCARPRGTPTRRTPIYIWRHRNASHILWDPRFGLFARARAEKRSFGTTGT
ncbi:hypothetical protein C8J57DRAFT_1233032 [Mycena rebaudengoi]|nr:hypothetical protein C8J57DRAFT_1233032 [Mycena rebaudengoi]